MAVYQVIETHNKVFDFVRDNKTDILTYGGIGLMTASTIAACVGTKKLIEQKEEIAEEPDIVKRVWARSRKFVLATGFWAAGAYCIHESHGIMKAENLALSNTVTSLLAGSMAYRKRWQDKVGEEEEKKIFIDEKTEEIVDENGKKKKVKTTHLDPSISTERYFDRYCSWRADPNGDIDYDGKVIENVQEIVNQLLWGNGEHYVFLDEVYNQLGLFVVNEFGERVADRSIAGRNGGWILDKKNPTGDNTIIIKKTKTVRRLNDGTVVPTWLLEFNIDGNIVKPLRERGRIQ